MVFLSMCYSLSVNMPRTHTRETGEGGASIAEGFRVFAQSCSLNERVVESQNIWEEDPRVGFIYSRSLKFRAVEKERRSTRSRKLKKRRK